MLTLLNVLYMLLSMSHTLLRVCKQTARLDYDNGGEGRVFVAGSVSQWATGSVHK